jgi:polyisoprenoid-binding protein YceI
LFSIFSRVGLTALLSFVAVLPAQAAARTFTLAPDSTIEYRGTHPAHRWTGVSHAVAGTITLDGEDAPTLPVTLCVPVRSFDSANRNRDSNALTYLDAGRFPKVCVRIDTMTVLEKPGGGNVHHGKARLGGVLTFHGVTRPLSLLLEGEFTGDRLRADGEFTLLLSDFQIKRPALLFVPMDDTITGAVHLRAVAR